MREIRTSGSEGGDGSIPFPTPIDPGDDRKGDHRRNRRCYDRTPNPAWPAVRSFAALRPAESREAKHGASCQDRTGDLLITNQLLYHLS